MMQSSRNTTPRPPPRRGPGRAFATSEGDQSPRAPSDRTVSEYMIANERLSVRDPQPSTSRGGFRDNQSDIYAQHQGTYKAPSEFSRASYPRSEAVSVKSKISRKGGAVVETVSAPSPFCPDTRGICCLMLLLNLGIMLICLGFIIVIQFYDPLIIWILGIIFLVFGFVTLIGSLIYCVYVCRDAKDPREFDLNEFYWTNRWRGKVGSAPPSEIHYRSEHMYSDEDRSGISKLSSRRSDRY
ncbi:uncharacterized protein LOC132193866 [Neocloeon triangulifer]|uniref:uncharacterized protein LOC132193866 n=1 Tax=Neocloeon triangulifer TaxID=2078957 RepID=UPI00286F92F6|nr:uncharacterized protein LOC132193866 [Neocloeon triangulifer]